MSWDVVKLEKVCKINMGQSPKGEYYNNSKQGFPLVGGASDFGHLFPTPKKYTSKETKLSSKGDLILCIRATIGDLNWSDKVYCLGRGVVGLSPISAKLNKNYLWFYLKSYEKELVSSATGSTFKQVSSEIIKAIQIPLPPLPEQQRIADILDKAEAITQKREQALEFCDEFLRATFLDMFGDPVSNPKGWEVNILKNLTSKIGSGSTPRGGKESYLDSGMTLVRSLNIYDDEFVRKGLAFISKAQADKLSNVALEADDILLNITGASVCRCSMMDNSLLPARVNQHVCIIRPNGIDNLFLLHLLISKNYKRKLMTLATSGGATREALTKEDITELGIIVPPIQLQQKFSSIVEKINGIKTRIQEAQELPLFDALSQQAFKGELTQ